MDRIDIVMVTMNRREFTEKAIYYLKERTKTPYRLIVVDNNSTDGTQQFLLDMKRDGFVHHLVLLEENYGIHMAKNYGLALVRSNKYYIDTDNDILCAKIEPDWIGQLVYLMDKYPLYGAITCRPQVLVGRGGDEFKTAPEVVPFNHTGAHLRIMRTDIVRQVGGWEKNWTANRNHEDSFIAARLQEAGYQVGYARDVRCFHLFGENWGYKDIPIDVHGHREMWPPPEHWDTLLGKLDPDTFQEKPL